MKPEEAINLYLQSEHERGLAENTIYGDRHKMKSFLQFCRAHHIDDMRNVDMQKLLDYENFIRTQKKLNGELWDPAYQNHHIGLVRRMFRMLAERDLLLADITLNLPELHEPRQKLPRGILTKDQVMNLLREPPLTTPLGFRDRAMLEVLYSTALRGFELCNLEVYDLDIPERTLRVLGKGSKERVVPIGKAACGYLSEYMENVRPLFQMERKLPYVFLTVTGRRLRTRNLRKMIKTYCRRAGLPDRITTHSLRHTCATELLRGGADIRYVQELLGHSDIGTTQIYTRVLPDDLKKIHARTAPSERRKPTRAIAFDPENAGISRRSR